VHTLPFPAAHDVLGATLWAANAAVETVGAVAQQVRSSISPVASSIVARPMRDLSWVLDLVVPTVAEAALKRVNLTEMVMRNVDLDSLVATVDLDAVASRLDLEAIVARLDLVHLAETVITGVDLPEIVRGSTGSMSSYAVRGARMQGISGDDAVGRALGRLRHRRRPEAVEPRARRLYPGPMPTEPERS
jgi:hypothetical protein